MSAPDLSALPIASILPALGQLLLRTGRAVLQAPPGAGKTTGVPLHLMPMPALCGKIVMLEPRRVAARASAERLASQLGEPVGASVGLRMRGESLPGARIEVVTEGVLTRMLQSDPSLPGIGCVIFDEFHERALTADLGLALVLETRAALRPDLWLVVMSATLDAEPVAALIGAEVLSSEGRAHPVETRWLDRPWDRAARLEQGVADLVETALAETAGGMLVFLPGRAEIARTAARLVPRLAEGVVLQELHGGLALKAQRAALAPVPGRRKLVLATAIAETSLTIPDVRVVIDAGRARRPRFDPGSGLSRLVTERVSRAEADQRRGRAGRVAPGWCYRCWTRGEEGGLAPFAPPEIAAADLAGLALELALWGTPAEKMAFLTPPPGPALAEARALLADLGAMDPAGRITPHGRALAGLPLHPRLAQMLRLGSAMGAGARACDLAALLEARDPLRGAAGPPPADLALRLAALADPQGAEAAHPIRVDRTAIAAIRAASRRLRRLAGPDAPGANPPDAGTLLALAYPDRVAQRLPGPAPRYLMSNGKGAALAEDDPLAGTPYLVAADLDGDPREARIRRAAPISEADLRDVHADRLRVTQSCDWSRRNRSVVARERLMLGAIALDDRPWTGAAPEMIARTLIAGALRDLGRDALPWMPAHRLLVARISWLRAQGEAALPDLSNDGLAALGADWLAPFARGMSRIDDLARLDLGAALDALLGWDARRTLDRLAPAEIAAPTGTRLRIDYAQAQPTVAVRLQEMFGLTTHPVIGPRRLPVTLALLSPAGRPVQMTADLPGFWASSYAEVRRDLRGRYPRHPWPEDPAAAEPTRRAKPRRM